MNGGPTVRRLHREREQRLRQGGHGARRPDWLPHRRILTGNAPLPEPGEFGREFTGLRATHGPGRAAFTTSQLLRAPFPVDMAGVLGVGANQGVLVMDGRLGHFFRHQQSPTDPQVECGGATQYIHFEGTVGQRLAQTLEASWASLRQWCSEEGGRHYAELDVLSGQPAGVALDRLDGFVNERLIPFIQEYTDGEEKEGGRNPMQRELSDESVVERVAPALDGCFAFVPGRWLRLVPFCGKPRPGELLLKVGAEQLIGIQSQPESIALAGYDTALQEAVTTADAGAGNSECDLYRNERYAVIRTPRGRYFVCQRLPPYVVEGIDKKLYYFEGAEIGIQITSTQVKGVITSACVQVLHSYRHMFVGSLGIGNFICMPRDFAYYEDLYRRPLERALLEHLESGRMTLCAGYQSVNACVHPIQSAGRKTIGPSEVRRRNLPVYRFRDPRRRAGPKVI